MNFSQIELRKLEISVTSILKDLQQLLIQEWQRAQAVSLKALREPVTEIDIRVEKEIRGALAKLLPEAGFIVEEGDSLKGKEYQWVIDPIDQTKNFIGHIPLFYTQVALVYRDEPILGVILNPVSGQLFSASSGNGTKLNGETIIKNVKDTLSEALVDIDFGGNSEGVDWKMPALSALAQAAYRIRITGGAFAPYLITGGIDAFISLSEVTKIVDQMPRIILTRELGLTSEILDIGGRRVYLAGSKTVFDEIRKILTEMVVAKS